MFSAIFMVQFAQYAPVFVLSLQHASCAVHVKGLAPATCPLVCGCFIGIDCIYKERETRDFDFL